MSAMQAGDDPQIRIMGLFRLTFSSAQKRAGSDAGAIEQIQRRPERWLLDQASATIPKHVQKRVPGAIHTNFEAISYPTVFRRSKFPGPLSVMVQAAMFKGNCGWHIYTKRGRPVYICEPQLPLNIAACTITLKGPGNLERRKKKGADLC